MDEDDPVRIRRELLRLSQRTAARLREQGCAGRTISLKVRFADFRTITRVRTLPDPTDVAREIYVVADQLYAALALRRTPLRLVGVRVQGLLPVGRTFRQLRLGPGDAGWRDAERAVHAATRRFGPGAVRLAALVGTQPPGLGTAGPATVGQEGV